MSQMNSRVTSVMAWGLTPSYRLSSSTLSGTYIELIADYTEKWAKVIKLAGIKPE
jgi:hypothetical protein